MVDLGIISDVIKALLPVLESILKKSRLFAVVLYDERPSHAPVKAFLEQNGVWLDSLAEASTMLPLRNPIHSQTHALTLARQFGILPNQFPGVLIFTLTASSDRVKSAVFLPLKTELFQKDLAAVERVFADLFSIFQEALASTSTSEELLARLRQEVASIRREQMLRPLRDFLRERLISIGRLPDKLLEKFVESFGEGLAKSLSK